VTLRTALRSAALAASVPLSAVLASPAAAITRDDGDQPGAGLTALETLLWFVAVPAGLFVLISLLVIAPSAARGPRYRPGSSWWAAPVWFGGPQEADPDAAVAAAQPTGERGGASARW